MPDLCIISGTVYTGAGAAMPAGEKVLFVYEVWKDGVLVSDKSFDVYTSTGGVVTFAVPRDSTIRVAGMIRGLTTKTWLTVPNAATATLESLLPAISPPSSAISQAAFNTALALKADLASPALTGVPTAPTAAPGTDTTQLATTAFVQAGLLAAVPTSEVVQDALSTFFPDSGIYDWTYDDDGNRVQLAISNATTLAPGLMSAADKTKLDGVATGATANSSDVTLLARANHTGAQSADTLTDGTTNKAFTAAEQTKLAGVATGATANATDAQLRDRSTHTGTQAAATISDFGVAALTAAPAETITTMGGLISGATSKPTPADADTLGLSDSAASNVLKSLTWANLKATLKTYFDTLYQTVLTFTGTGDTVRAASPTLITPTLGAASATSLNVALLNPAANVLEQRNGTNAQSSRIYGSYTDASNYHRLALTYSGSEYQITSQNAGTGGAQDIFIKSASRVYLSGGGNNGQWIISTTGQLLDNNDNTHDIGASGANRPRSGYFGTSVRAPKFETAASVQWTSGTGSPEGVVTANIGSLYTRTDGGAATVLYVKESGTGNTGWVAK